FIQNKEWTEAAGGIDYRPATYHQGEQERQYLIVRATPEYTRFIDNAELKKAMEGNEYFCIINQGMQRMLTRDSIEEYVSGADGETYTITATITDDHSPRAYVPFTGNELTQIYIRLHATADTSKAKEELSAFIGEFLPVNFQFPVHTEAEGIQSMISIYSFFIWVFAVCAVISILISVLGIFGAISIDTERRQKEVAIRKINGAGMKDIYWLLGRLYVTLYVVAGGLAIIIGWVVLKAMTSNPRWFNEMFNPAQPLLWIGVVSTSVFIVFLTVYSRIRKITQINPAEIIKTE
ncbi:ABC transporter permease, partial [Bacteroides sp. OttesenSCG-928-E20]|nr:ABC transporter permease [Bacteroides sp. OttesenSCG-928-E20]